MIYTLMTWYAIAVTVVIIVAGLTFGYLYHTRTGGKWRGSELGRHLMAFTLAPVAVLILSTIRVREVWWILIQLAAYTTVPLVYIRQIRIFLKVQKEISDEPGQDH